MPMTARFIRASSVESLATRLSVNPADAKSHLFDRAAAALGRPVGTRLFVPGRIEFLGKHTDYAGGRSLICAIDRGIAMVVSPRDDAAVQILDAGSASRSEFELSPELKPMQGDWSNYPMTVGRRIARNFAGDLRGADIAFASDLPAAAGLSSSSALMIATFLALDAVNDLCHRPEYLANIRSDEDLAAYLATIENGQTLGALLGDAGVGTLGGSQDHTAILCGRAGMLRQYGFCPVTHERDVPLPADHVFVIAVSGVVAHKTGEARELYNRASRSVSQIMESWRAATGRDDPTLAAAVRSAPDAADRLRQLLPSPLIARLDQFVAESEQIIPSAGDALVRNDLPALSGLVARSQELAERLLKNQVRETIALARLARECGAAAASAFGAGFGGSVWALVNERDAEAFVTRWREQYLRRFLQHRDRADFFVTRAAPPARRPR
jgi:galactokinase